MTTGFDAASTDGGIAIDGGGYASSGTRPIAQVASPNHDARPPDARPSLIVVHAISLPPGVFGGRAIDALFTNTLDPAAHPYFATIAALRVSAHFLVRRAGDIVQFVACDRRAWHAGVSSFEGRPACNDFSIGIELEGDDATAFRDAQYAALDALVAALRRRYPIEALARHSDIAPGRKTDPGPCFDWARACAGAASGLRCDVPS